MTEAATTTTHATTQRRRSFPHVRSLIVATCVVAGLVWLVAGTHAGGPLADAWEPTGGDLCLPAPQPGDATVALPVNPSSRVTLSDVELMGSDGVRLAGAFVVPGDPSSGASIGWSATGLAADGAVVGDHVGRTLMLHLVVDPQAAPRFDDVRITYRSSGFRYSTEVGTGLRAGADCT